MAGLIGSVGAPEQPQAAMPQETPEMAPQAAPEGGTTDAVEAGGSALTNPILMQIEQKFESIIKPEVKDLYMKILVACMRFAFGEETHDLTLKGFQSSPDMEKNIALVTVGMIGKVFEQGGNKKPDAFIAAAVPASIVLMCQLMQHAEQLGMMEVTNETVSKCTALTTKALLQKFGIDDKQIQEMKAKQGGAQPQAPQPAAPQPEVM